MVKFLNIGIDIYAAGVDELKGCVNDANNWCNFFLNSGFIPHSDPIINSFARRFDILDNLKNFIISLSENDIGIITYSGHGTLVKENNSIEEAIYGYEGKIKAKKIEDKLKHLKNGAKLVFFIDACYSENIIDISYIEKFKRFLKNIFLESRIKENIQVNKNKETIRFYSDVSLSNYEPKTSFADKIKNSNKHKIFLFTSSKENEKSFEREFENGETQGVFSHYALKILNEHDYRDFTYQTFYDKIQQEMILENKQTPDKKLVESLKNSRLFS